MQQRRHRVRLLAPPVCLRRTAAGWLVALALALLSGCATTSSSATNGALYKWDQVPPTLVAVKRDNPQTVDLSRLARATNSIDQIDRGDVIEVSIAASLNDKDTVTFPVRVTADGIAQLPVVGPLPLAGMDMESAEAAIVEACVSRELYRNPNVTVTMKRQRTNRVTVVGAVDKPGIYELPRGRSDLLAALVAAGSLAEDAGTMVEIRNPRRPEHVRPDAIAGTPGSQISPAGHSSVPLAGPSSSTDKLASTDVRDVSAVGALDSIRVDLISATKSGEGSYYVEDGGVVMVEKRDPEPVHVIGLVIKPNRYDFPVAEDLRVLDAIALASGISSPAANKVYVIRKQPSGNETVVLETSIAKAKRNEAANIRLTPGDTVSVEHTPATILIDSLRLLNFGFGASLPLTAL